MVTREDVKDMATKEGLKNIATNKDDINMLKSDINVLRGEVKFLKRFMGIGFTVIVILIALIQILVMQLGSTSRLKLS